MDKAIYNNILTTHSINDPKSIQRLNEIAAKVPYRPPRLLNIEDYPSDEEDEIHEANDERLKEENTMYLSEVMRMAFFDNDDLSYAPFFKIPNTKKLTVKYNNALCELDAEIVYDLIDQFIHKMQIIRKEKNISIFRVKTAVNEAYNDFRLKFVNAIKKYKFTG
jgi:hypothetical protein